MIVELAGEAVGPRGLSRAALPLIVACLAVALALPADRNAFQPLETLADVRPVRLVLPSNVSGVRLSAMPDRLLNDQPVSSLITSVQVRGLAGIASQENGTSTVMWSERGTVYWLTSARHDPAELVFIADRLSGSTSWITDREGRPLGEQP